MGALAFGPEASLAAPAPPWIAKRTRSQGGAEALRNSAPRGRSRSAPAHGAAMRIRSRPTCCFSLSWLLPRIARPSIRPDSHPQARRDREKARRDKTSPDKTRKNNEKERNENEAGASQSGRKKRAGQTAPAAPRPRLGGRRPGADRRRGDWPLGRAARSRPTRRFWQQRENFFASSRFSTLPGAHAQKMDAKQRRAAGGNRNPPPWHRRRKARKAKK